MTHLAPWHLQVKKLLRGQDFPLMTKSPTWSVQLQSTSCWAEKYLTACHFPISVGNVAVSVLSPTENVCRFVTNSRDHVPDKELVSTIGVSTKVDCPSSVGSLPFQKLLLTTKLVMAAPSAPTLLVKYHVTNCCFDTALAQRSRHATEPIVRCQKSMQRRGDHFQLYWQRPCR